MLLTTTSKINAIKDYLKAGDYDSAVEIAEKVNPEKVGSVRDLMTLANAFLKKRRYEDAKEVYIEMHNHASTHKVLVGLIELCLKTNSPEEAETYIREFRKLEPDNPERLIYRYRVDVMLGKGPEYLVKSLSRLKEEDYNDVWGLELAKAYFKMGDYQKCAQECKDILLWFAGTDAAAKAHVLLGACAENGVTVKMPEIKPHEEEPFDDEEAPDVPVIAATPVSEPEEEPAKESGEDFFDLSAAIGETVSEAIAEDREKALEEPEETEEYSEEAEETEEESEEAEEQEDEESDDGTFFEEAEEPVAKTVEEEEPEEELPDLEAVEDIKLPAYFEEDAEAEEPAEAADTFFEETEEVPADNTFFENSEEEAPADETFFEETEEPAEAEVAEEEPEEAEEEEISEKTAPETLGEFDIIALAVQKAREQDDDDDDVVIHDYFPEEKHVSKSSWDNEDAVPTLVTLPSSYKKAEPESEPEEFFFEPESIEEEKTETAPESEVTEEAEPEEIPEEQSVTDEDAEKSTEDAAFAPLFVDEEEDDGQLSFFATTRADEDMKLASDISGSIAEAVQDELANGMPEADEVSKAPTKVHTDLAAQALDAVLREDDEAIEKALYGLLSDK